MISGGHAGDWNAETATGRAREDGIAANMADAAAAYPGLQGLKIDQADVSHLESVSIDGIPIIDRVPGQQNMKGSANATLSGVLTHGAAPILTQARGANATCH